eukprot:GFUD01021038.1.p1 GENE.GFUD01021038.1~~GFUD01021038.1.p1  ORF type:complete len:136 (-),score=25.79 GFUD01021038.1:354-761(-)
MDTKTPRQKGFFQPKLSSAEKLIPNLNPDEASFSTPEPDSREPSRNNKSYFKTGENEETSGSAMLGLLCYSFMILFVPIFIYFGAKQALEDNDYEPPTTTIAPAVMAIASVNIVIVLYVLKAFREEDITSKNKTE